MSRMADESSENRFLVVVDSDKERDISSAAIGTFGK